MEESSFLDIAEKKKYGGGKEGKDCGGGTGKMPVCYLVKDMILQDDGDKNVDMLKNVLQTLMMHQQLTNKYLLSLIHH